MLLKYIDIFDNGRERTIRARLTTDHCASRYHQPVIVLPDGGALNYNSYILLGYSVAKISKKEQPLMQAWLNNCPPI